ncbi:MAG: ChaN family lipoprotein [Nitrospiraceae bacterium]
MNRWFTRSIRLVAMIFCLSAGASSTMAAADQDTSAPLQLDVRPENQPAARTTQEWKPGTIVSSETGESFLLEAWLSKLGGFDVIFLGEEHQNPEHIKAAILVLRALLAQGRHPLLGMEMFSWDGQPALDRYVTREQDADRRFLEDVRWKQNWGGSFENYAPLVGFARDHGISVLALNPPRPLVRSVVKDGMHVVVNGDEAAQWGMRGEELVEDAGYREAILDQLRACHGGGTERDYQGMYEASLFRDEGMAKTIAFALAREASAGVPVQGPFVSYTGGGHIQYRLPVPSRVARRTGPDVKQVTIYMTSFDSARLDEVQDMLNRHIADYLWLTPVGPQGPPRRCR